MTPAACADRYDRLRRLIDRRFAALGRGDPPGDLYAGCRHVLTAGGKRLRAVLTLLACEAAGAPAVRALHAGIAVELLHNFTLVHDDIMDHAPSRRGLPTVHIRWNVSTALLVGDTLMGVAYRRLLMTPVSDVRPIARLFTAGMIEVCEGQAMDLAFEQRDRVRLADYFLMIEKKTGRLITTALEIGGTVGGATAAQRAALRAFGRYLGRAFQMQDDLLDVIGDEKQFGKTAGGDIIEGKKTFLLLEAARRARGGDRAMLRSLLRRGRSPGRPPLSPEVRQRTVAAVTALYRRLGVIDEARTLIRHDTDRAVRALSRLPENRGTAMLRWLAGRLADRSA